MDLNSYLISPKKLVRISQPLTWLGSALLFSIGYLLAHPHITLVFILGFLYFLIPFQLLRHGLRLVGTHPLPADDVSQPLLAKRDRKPLLIWIVVSNIGFILYLSIIAPHGAKWFLGLLLLLVVASFMQPTKFAYRAFTDVLSTTLTELFICIYALLLGSGHTFYPIVLIALGLWLFATYTLKAIPNLQHDRAQQRQTIATSLGAHNSLVLSFWAYVLCTLLVMISYVPYGLIAGILLTSYCLNVSFFLKYRSDARAHMVQRAWKNTVALNFIHGLWLVLLLAFTLDPLHLGMARFSLLADVLIALSIAQTLLIIHNLAGFRRPEITSLHDYPKVSILIHTYNQADNISSTLLAVLGQNYPDFEILYADLGSSDNTLKIASSYQDERIRIERIRPIADDWTLNSWASQELLSKARGEIVVSLSADTVLLPDTIALIVSLLYNNDLDIVSLLPADQNKTLAQKLLLNQNRFFWLGLYPAAYLTKNWPKYSAAYSGLLAFRKQSLQALGGFEIVRRSPLEDLDLASQAKQNGLKTGFWLGSELAIMQNHASLRLIVLQNIQRYYPALMYNFPFSIAALSGGVFLFVLPPILLLWLLTTGHSSIALLFAVGIIMSIVNRLIIAITSRQSYVATIFYPLTNMFMLMLLGVSILNYELFKPRWEKRTEI